MRDRSAVKTFLRALVAIGIAGAGATLATGGCSMISGLDSLTQAASLDDDGGSGGPGDDASSQKEKGEAGSTGSGVSTCTPDPAFCNTHCGDAPDNCGQTRKCGTCGDNSTCDPNSHTCQCAVAPNFCAGRCGASTDNCTHAEDCGGCDAGLTCTGACGCSPEAPSVACGAKNCGSATNNCNQTVFCGAGGTSGCATATDFCKPGGTCCTPDNVTPCVGKCSQHTLVQVQNNCGQTISCPTDCPGGQECSGTSCCTPEPIATTCAGACNGAQKQNNCGDTVTCVGCSAGQVCDTTVSACCTSNGSCTNGHECGTGLDNCHQSVSCGICADVCSQGGTCNAGTGICTCRCGGTLQSTGGLHPELIQPCN